MNSSEHPKCVDSVFKEELSLICVGVHNLHETGFEDVAGLEAVSKAVLEKYTAGNDPLFCEG